jgi:hypothetical protein
MRRGYPFPAHEAQLFGFAHAAKWRRRMGTRAFLIHEL